MNLSLRHTGSNQASVYLPGIRIDFSYETPIAFSADSGDSAVRENDWGPTTGKHLTVIDGGSREARALRLSGEEFKARLDKALSAAHAPQHIDNRPALPPQTDALGVFHGPL